MTEVTTGPRPLAALAVVVAVAALAAVAAMAALAAPVAGATGTAFAAMLARPAAPRPTAVEGFLRSIDAGPARKAWAAGAGASGTLTLHWNGTTWTRVPSPSPPRAGSDLSGVAVTSGGSAWAVGGFARGPDGNSRILILRWDGSAWRRVRVPGLPAQGGLYAVSATSPRNVWAVGYSGAIGGAADTMTLHWNGTAWHRVPSPSPVHGGDNELYAVAATSASSAWAVGYAASAASSRSLILHWNGTAWRRVASPGGVTLNGVAAASARDGWAVGSTDAYPYRTVTLHWNGSTWRQVASPNPAAGTVNILYGVAATAPGRAWAVGDAGTKPLILRWDGTTWTRVHSPCPAGDCQLFAITAQAAGGTWAAGENGHLRPLILRWNGTAWQPAGLP